MYTLNPNWHIERSRNAQVLKAQKHSPFFQPIETLFFEFQGHKKIYNKLLYIAVDQAKSIPPTTLA